MSDEEKMDNVRALPGVEKKDPMTDLLNLTIRNMVTIMELHKVRAKLYKHKFDELVAAGFTPAQAIELCKQGYLL